LLPTPARAQKATDPRSAMKTGAGEGKLTSFGSADAALKLKVYYQGDDLHYTDYELKTLISLGNASFICSPSRLLRSKVLPESTSRPGPIL
jgi:hypothetical protein